jgi:hypothetical protein
MAIKKYSTTTEQTFIPRMTRIAAFVDIPSIRAMKRGFNTAMNAQMRRIDLVCKLIGPLFIALIEGISTKVVVLALHNTPDVECYNSALRG